MGQGSSFIGAPYLGCANSLWPGVTTVTCGAAAGTQDPGGSLLYTKNLQKHVFFVSYTHNIYLRSCIISKVLVKVDILHFYVLLLCTV